MAVLYSFLLLLLRKRTKKNKRIKDFQNEYLSTSSFFFTFASQGAPSIYFFLFSLIVTPSIAKQEKEKRNIVSYRGFGLWYYIIFHRLTP